MQLNRYDYLTRDRYGLSRFQRTQLGEYIPQAIWAEHCMLHEDYHIPDRHLVRLARTCFFTALVTERLTK